MRVCLLAHRGVWVQVIVFLKKKDKFVSLVLRHIGTSALMDLLLRLVSCVEPAGLRQEVLHVSAPPAVPPARRVLQTLGACGVCHSGAGQGLGARSTEAQRSQPPAPRGSPTLGPSGFCRGSYSRLKLGSAPARLSSLCPAGAEGEQSLPRHSEEAEVSILTPLPRPDLRAGVGHVLVLWPGPFLRGRHWLAGFDAKQLQGRRWPAVILECVRCLPRRVHKSPRAPGGRRALIPRSLGSPSTGVWGLGGRAVQSEAHRCPRPRVWLLASGDSRARCR